jgi:hypothetical protein
MLDDALDSAVFSGGIPALENDQDSVPVLDNVPLNFDEFDLQVTQRSPVGLAALVIDVLRFG